MKPLDHPVPPASPRPAGDGFAWLPGLAAIDTGITPIVGDGARPLFRHISLMPAQRSAAILLDNRLELRVAPADHTFALALIAAFVAPPGRPAAAAAASHDLLALAARVAPKNVSILIEGATGTGKEGLARLLHSLSQRRDCPFVAVNCAALPETMLEATLFGHERGAFTGAIAAGQGLFRAAQGGTLFLDEVAELPLALQAKLLRAVQEREVMPVGATVAQPVDVRIIAAANRDLAGEVVAGRFRADLFYRLAVFPLRTLPLADRPADITAITAHRLLQVGQGRLPWPTPRALAALAAHDWPGNVRELGNVIDRALVLSDTPVIDLEHLVFDRLAGAADPMPPGGANPSPLPGQVRHHEARVIRDALAHCPSRRAAAQALGISERTLRYKLAAMGHDAGARVQ